MFILSGFIIAGIFFKEEPPLAKAVLGLSFGLLLIMWLPALCAFLFGFTLFTQFLALIICVATLCVVFYLCRKRLTGEISFSLQPLEEPIHLLLIPMFLLTVYLLYTHVLLPVDGGLSGGQSTFGDMPMHLSFITSLTVQEKFPPVYSLIARPTAMGYPFLCDSISSTFYTLSNQLKFSYILPMLAAMLSVFYGAYILFFAWLKHRVKAILAVLLFFVGGGFGFAYFLDMLQADPQRFMGIFQGFYTTPTNYVERNVIWVNVIADLLIPQRATLFGWSILFPALYLLYRAAFDGKSEYLIACGILGGSLPLIHTHSFLALAVLSGVYLIRAFRVHALPELKFWAIYAVIAFLLAAPQLWFFTFAQAAGEQFLRPHFNWANSSDNYFWFYIKNWGLMYLLLLPAFLHARKSDRWFYAGGLALLAICEVFVFQPNEYDNNKLLFVWYLLSCGLVANFLLDFYAFTKNFGGVKILAVITVLTMNLSGILTLGREAVSGYELFNSAGISAAEYISENTPADAVFLTADNHNNAVASLTGRTIFCGSGSYLFFHGIEYMDYKLSLPGLYQNPSLEALRNFNINYVYISDYEWADYPYLDREFFQNNLELCYDNGIVQIYKVN